MDLPCELLNSCRGEIEGQAKPEPVRGSCDSDVRMTNRQSQRTDRIEHGVGEPRPQSWAEMLGIFREQVMKIPVCLLRVPEVTFW